MILGYLVVKSKGAAGRKEAQVSHTDPEWGLGVDAETPNAALVNLSKSGRVVSKFLVPEFAQALKLSAKKPLFGEVWLRHVHNIGSILRQLQAWLNGILLSLYNLSDYIIPLEIFQSHWLCFSKANLLEIRSFSKTAFTLWLQ